jgi:hypothetical protein
MANKSITDMNDQELIVVQKNGVDALNFLEGNDFFKRVLQHAIEHEREQAKIDSDWAPGKSTDPVEGSMINAFNSGKRMGLALINTVCNRIIKRGMDASAEIIRRSKKKDKKDAI